MSDFTLILDHHQNEIEINAQTLIIRKDGQLINKAPLRMLDQVLVHSNVIASSKIWRQLCDNDIDVVFLPTRTNGNTVFLQSSLTNSYPTRAAQHTLSEAQKLDVAKKIISDKTQSQIHMAEFLKQNLPQHSKKWSLLKNELKLTLESINNFENIDQLRGCEGAASRKIYQLLIQIITPEWLFNGRNKNPALDPFNSILSLGYTLLLSEISKYATATGFDTAVGFLHPPYPARPSLALDLIEPFRASIIIFCLSLIQQDGFNADKFSLQANGCRMDKSLRGHFYGQWSQLQADWPVTHQVRRDKNNNLSSAILKYCKDMQQFILDKKNDVHHG